jgi:hypothetical protein
MIPTTELEPYLQKQVDNGLPGTDILHGALKNMMLDTEQILNPLLENSNELGSDEEYEDTVQRLYSEGYMDALTEVYALTYNLAFAINERTKKNAN